MELLRRILALFTWRQRRRDLQEEMTLHRDLLGDGRKFGNYLRLRERSFDQWGWRWLSEFGQDVRHGLRLLARTPVATTLALLSLTLGIGANTALFSLTDALLLRPLPISHPEQLVRLIGHLPPKEVDDFFSNPYWEMVRDHQSVLPSIFAELNTKFDLATGGEDEIQGLFASGDYFRTLEVQAVRGRLFTTTDDYRGCPAVADISESLWRSRFAAAPQALGSQIKLSGHPFTVIGIMPAWFFGTVVDHRNEVVVPLCTEPILSQPSRLNVTTWVGLRILGRLGRGTSLAAAQSGFAAEHNAWTAALPSGDPRMGAMSPTEKRAFWLEVQPAGAGFSDLRARYAPPLEALIFVSGLVLLIASANLSGLMLARSAARREEFAVRTALGASRLRLVRQLLTESLLLALGGAGLGALLAAWACHAATAFLSLPGYQVRLNLAPDARVLLFAAGLTLATALAVGLWPALRATRSERAHTTAIAGWLVPAQLALALLLLAGAGLFLRSFLILTGPGKGFNPNGLVLATVTSEPPGRPAPDLASGLQAIPGMDQLSSSYIVPAQGSSWGAYVAAVGGSTAPRAQWNAVSPGFFAELQTPMLQGRDFAPSDGAATQPVAIVNVRLAQILFPGQSAVGHQIRRVAYATPPSVPAEVVGVVADAKNSRLESAAPPIAYFPFAQVPAVLRKTYYLRTRLPELALAAAVRATAAHAQPPARVKIESYDSLQAAGVKPQRMLATLSEGFGFLALLIAAIGLYGGLAYEASRRRREFGVRMALGARPAAIRRLVLSQATTRLFIGMVAGLGLAWLAGRAAQPTLGSVLYGVAPTDSTTLGTAAALLFAVGLAAAWLPARRAARADPMLALREE